MVTSSFQRADVTKDVARNGTFESASASSSEAASIIDAAAKNADGNPVQIGAVLIDAGFCFSAVAEFVSLYGGVFKATKGIGGGRFYHGKPSAERQVGNNWFGQIQPGRFWLYSLDADYWKKSVHERFIAEPFDENNRPNAGSLTLFVPEGSRDHKSFSAHVLSEEWISEFKIGKGERSRWLCHSKNNHWLDASAMLLCGAEMSGRGLFAKQPAPEQQKRPVVISRGIDTQRPRW